MNEQLIKGHVSLEYGYFSGIIRWHSDAYTNAFPAEHSVVHVIYMWYMLFILHIYLVLSALEYQVDISNKQFMKREKGKCVNTKIDFTHIIKLNNIYLNVRIF